MKSAIFLPLVLLLASAKAESLPCNPRPIPGNSVVCVCNATYCDTIEPLPSVPPGHFHHIVSSFSGQRFQTSLEELQELPENGTKIRCNTDL
jgi:glucosylceramidase